jgi:tetratricopeptide (TPR) repeat protein
MRGNILCRFACRFACTFAAFFCTISPAAAETHWSRMASPHFEMYTTTDERSARDTLRYFEQVRSVFAQAMPKTSAQNAAVRIIAFSSMKEYEPYRMNDFAVAYYHPGADHDSIVMSQTGAETFPIAIHEYVHLVVEHARLKLPPWLNEGLAELYSTLRPLGDKILVGSLIPGRYRALQREKWVPLSIILRAGHDSPYYNEKNKAGSLYNEGWALTHMLVLSPDYRPKFAEFLRLVNDGVDSAEALEKTYRVPISQIETELERYLRGGQFRGMLIPVKLEKIDEEMHEQPADDFEIKLLLAELGDRPGREQEMRAALAQVAAQYPTRPEPHVDLARLDWRQQDRNGARAQFEKAFDLGSRNPQMLWDYGRMEEAADAGKASAAFSELLKQEPDRIDVRLELASAQLRAQKPKEALATLAPIKKIRPDDAPRLFLLLAHADLDAGDRSEARVAAERLKQVAKTDEDRDRAGQLLSFLDRSDGAPQQQARAPSAEPDAPPVIRRRPAPQSEFTETVERSERASFSGNFLELQCSSPTKIVLETAAGKKVLLIDDPTRLVVNGNNGETKELSCGRQKPASVRIEYDSPSTSRPGSDGVARVIHFGEP